MSTGRYTTTLDSPPTTNQERRTKNQELRRPTRPRPASRRRNAGLLTTKQPENPPRGPNPASRRLSPGLKTKAATKTPPSNRRAAESQPSVPHVRSLNPNLNLNPNPRPKPPLPDKKCPTKNPPKTKPPRRAAPVSTGRYTTTLDSPPTTNQERRTKNQAQRPRRLLNLHFSFSNNH